MNGRVHGTGPEIDLLEPEILAYEPQSHGSMEVVALECLVFADTWDANHQGPPSYEDRDFHYMEDDSSTEVNEAHGVAPHYDVHMWLLEDKPSGTFTEWSRRTSHPDIDSFRGRAVGRVREGCASGRGRGLPGGLRRAVGPGLRLSLGTPVFALQRTVRER